MNNLRLLTGLLFATLMGSGVSVCAQTQISLDEIFEIAEKNSVQLRPFITSEKEADKEISVARNALMPDIEASMSLSYIGDGFTTKRDFSDFSRAAIPHFGSGLSLNITQPVYTGGAVKSAIELAELKSTAARYATEFCRNNIRFQITGFYLHLYKYSNLRTVVEQNLVSARKVLVEMKSRFEQGIALRNDITRYELLVSNLELQLVRINNTIDILNNNLVTTAGLPSNTRVVPDSTILSRSMPYKTENQWQQDAVENSSTLKITKNGVDISRKAESLMRSERLPKVGIKAGWTIDGPILVEVPPINRNLSYWYVGVGVSYNISSLYKNNRSLAKSRLSTRKAVEELAAAQENISISVRTDYTRYLEAYEELKSQQKSVELACRNYGITATRYSADMALITDLLDAANARLEAEQNLVNARINIIYYYYKLLFTTGQI